MAPEFDAEDVDDSVSVAAGTLTECRIVLIVDPASSGDLVMNRCGEAWSLCRMVLPLHDAAPTDSRVRARGVRNMVPEVLCVGETASVCQLFPFVQERSVDEHAKLRLAVGLTARPPRRDQRCIAARPRFCLARQLRPYRRRLVGSSAHVGA
jgi:hypothetical protein